MEAQVHGNRNESWTNEKHVRFLNSVEARFVRTMLENNDRSLNLRLDRHLPDSSESTLDGKQNHATKKHAASAIQTRPKEYRKRRICLKIFVDGSLDLDFMGTIRGQTKVRPDKRSRRPVPSQPHDSSQDQVVPQIETKTGDKDAKHLPNLPVAAFFV